mmetsp:Transcript_94084/g.271937  ORF Transcript_94084/g.271937 Transcript_94084/m.271937 type:complete len:354 (-) Transcript_94084:434-1495(-)
MKRSSLSGNAGSLGLKKMKHVNFMRVFESSPGVPSPGVLYSRFHSCTTSSTTHSGIGTTNGIPWLRNSAYCGSRVRTLLEHAANPRDHRKWFNVCIAAHGACSTNCFSTMLTDGRLMADSNKFRTSSINLSVGDLSSTVLWGCRTKPTIGIFKASDTIIATWETVPVKMMKSGLSTHAQWKKQPSLPKNSASIIERAMTCTTSKCSPRLIASRFTPWLTAAMVSPPTGRNLRRDWLLASRSSRAATTMPFQRNSAATTTSRYFFTKPVASANMGCKSPRVPAVMSITFFPSSEAGSGAKVCSHLFADKGQSSGCWGPTSASHNAKQRNAGRRTSGRQPSSRSKSGASRGRASV